MPGIRLPHLADRIAAPAAPRAERSEPRHRFADPRASGVPGFRICQFFRAFRQSNSRICRLRRKSRNSSRLSGHSPVLKLVSKILCILREKPVRSGTARGRQIAQIAGTPGQASARLLQRGIPEFLARVRRRHRVTTFVNVEFRVDFILEMAKSTFQPVNEFSTDLPLRDIRRDEIRRNSEQDQPQDVVPQGQTKIDINGPQGMRRTAGHFQNVRFQIPSAHDELRLHARALSFKEFVAYLDREKNNELRSPNSNRQSRPKRRNWPDRTKNSSRRSPEFFPALRITKPSTPSLTRGLLADNAEKFGIVKDSIRAEIKRRR